MRDSGGSDGGKRDKTWNGAEKFHIQKQNNKLTSDSNFYIDKKSIHIGQKNINFKDI